MKNSRHDNETANQEFRWQLHCLPAITRANRYFLKDRNFKTVYCSSAHHALHMYDYSGEMYIGDRLVKISRGDITISPRGVKTSYHLERDDGGWHYCAHFAAGSHEFEEEDVKFSMPLYFPAGENYTENAVRFQEIITLFALAQKSEIAGFGAANALRQFLLWLAVKAMGIASDSASSSKLEQKIKSAQNYIDMTLDQPFSIGQLAGRCEISRNYLTQMFRKKCGMTIQRYVLQRRIDKAKHLLETTAMSIKEIGVMAGFSDPQHFNKRFRLAANCSPSEFRRKPRG
ncbi:MAG: helix-turn-helix domain-containing protein [Victivallaceae bacterium]